MSLETEAVKVDVKVAAVKSEVVAVKAEAQSWVSAHKEVLIGAAVGIVAVVVAYLVK
jgi:hypothetical protein